VTIGVLGVVAVAVLEGRLPVTPSYVVGMALWGVLCITVWWMLSRPHPKCRRYSTI
jgi:hypothetical protein